MIRRRLKKAGAAFSFILLSNKKNGEWVPWGVRIALIVVWTFILSSSKKNGEWVPMSWSSQEWVVADGRHKQMKICCLPEFKHDEALSLAGGLWNIERLWPNTLTRCPLLVCIHINIHTYIIYTYMHAYMHTYIYMYIHTYIHNTKLKIAVNPDSGGPSKLSICPLSCRN